jgi:hypothetical protein
MHRLQAELRLACTGELLELGSIGLAVSRAGGLLMEFICPRCDELHLSRLFRCAGSVSPSQELPAHYTKVVAR